jgi:hypothetical protein
LPEITPEQLTAALDGMEITVDVLNSPVPGQWVGATVRYPESLASAILARIAEPGHGPGPHPNFDCGECPDCNPGGDVPAVTDPELGAIARILTELDALDGESGAGRQSALRALTYVASRYGYVLADED